MLSRGRKQRVLTRRLRGGLCALALVLAAVTASAALPAVASAGVDDWVHIWEVVRLAEYQQSQPSPPPGVFVYLLGDSIGRESVVSDASWKKAMAKKAAAAGKVTVSAAYDVSGHNQTFGEDEKIVQGLPSTPLGRPKGIVLIGVGISRFIGPPKADVHPASLPGTNIEPPPLSAWVQHHYDGRRPLPLSRKRELVPRWMDSRWTGFKAYRKDNVAKIQEVVDLCQSKGLRPIILELPLDLRVVGSGLDRPLHAIRNDMTRLASREGIRYIRFDRALNLPTSSFWDLHHLLRPGYERWQARLSAEVVKGLPKP